MTNTLPTDTSTDQVRANVAAYLQQLQQAKATATGDTTDIDNVIAMCTTALGTGNFTAILARYPRLADTSTNVMAVTSNTNMPATNNNSTLNRNGQNVDNGLNLTPQELIMIQNFADRKQDAGDDSGYKLKVVDENGELSKKYYVIDGNTVYRKGDPDKKPIYFTNLHLQLNEYDYERYVASLKEYTKKTGRKLNDLSDDEKAEKEANKPWLVKSADWLDQNLFGSVADMFGSGFLSILGSGIKMVGGVLTGLMRTIGYAFNGDWEEAGSSALGWLKDAAITGLIAWGSSALIKKFSSSNESSSTTSTTTSTEASNTVSTTTTNNTITVTTVSGASGNSQQTTDLMNRLNKSTTATLSVLQRNNQNSNGA